MTAPYLKHARLIRWTHWLNVPILVLMIWSGILIYWADDGYGPFFPDSFYEALGLQHRLAEGMAVHFFVAWLFTLNGILYGVSLLLTHEWRELIPRKETLRESLQVVLHDLGIRKQPLPRKKFNDAQKIAYTGVILMGAGSVLTGLAIYKPAQLGWLKAMLGGYAGAHLIHFLLMLGYVAFAFIHILQVLRAGWNNLRSMISGYEAP